MSVKLQPNMTQSPYDIKICEDYWAYNNKGDFIKHVKTLCEKYDINPQVLFETIAQCYVYLDDVICEYCGYPCQIEVPADIPYMQAKNSWLCAICEHALWRTDKENKWVLTIRKARQLRLSGFFVSGISLYTVQI